MPSRRQFVRDCSAATAAAVLAPLSLHAGRLREVSLADLSFDKFARLIRTGFALRTAGGRTHVLELAAAQVSTVAGSNFAETERDVGQCFSLIFRGPETQPLGQDTYWFEHPRLGRFEMFIVPIGCPERGQCRYEAVINRLPMEVLGRELARLQRGSVEHP